jgi:hypothetical protein
LSIKVEIFHKTKIKIEMKKLFIVLAIASLGFVACNNESKTEVKEDTTTVAPAPAPVDTTAAPSVQDTTAKPDTTKK